MSNKTSSLLISLLLLFLVSCSEKEDLEQSGELKKLVINEFVGVWTDVEYADDSIQIYKKVVTPPEDEYFLQVLPDNQLKEHKNSGWCGTPPISYDLYEGNWKTQDSTIIIDVPYWGGMVHQNWQILEINDQTLKIKILSMEFERD